MQPVRKNPIKKYIGNIVYVMLGYGGFMSEVSPFAVSYKWEKIDTSFNKTWFSDVYKEDI